MSISHTYPSLLIWETAEGSIGGCSLSSPRPSGIYYSLKHSYTEGPLEGWTGYIHTNTHTHALLCIVVKTLIGRIHSLAHNLNCHNKMSNPNPNPNRKPQSPVLNLREPFKGVRITKFPHNPNMPSQWYQTKLVSTLLRKDTHMYDTDVRC